MDRYWIYILTNKNNAVLYIGITNEISRRVNEHKQGLVAGFTQRYKLKKLVYIEEYVSIKEAIAREKQLKNWHRDWKFNLIQSVNPDFCDLSLEVLIRQLADSMT
jgi:putative endonuclease